MGSVQRGLVGVCLFAPWSDAGDHTRPSGLRDRLEGHSNTKVTAHNNITGSHLDPQVGGILYEKAFTMNQGEVTCTAAQLRRADRMVIM